MARNFVADQSSYVPEHIQPEVDTSTRLKAKIDAANMTEMWDMILALDYEVSSVTELSSEKKDEFLNVMSLLLKAFDR